VREYIRHPTDIPIEYDLGEVVSDRTEYLKNISEGGLCFHADIPIEAGSVINIRIPLQDPAFAIKGVVVWCKKSDERYDVGVQFADASSAFRARMLEQVCHIEHYKAEVLEKEGRELTGEEAAVEWIAKRAKSFPS
jgi:PilZ domain-containing protein